MEFRAVRESELELWARLCEEGFGGDPDWEYFQRHAYCDPALDFAGIFAAWDGDRPVSSVRVFSRRFYIGGEGVPGGGIGEVCTLPSHRKQGLSGKLLEMAIGYMAERDLPISLLFTGVNPHYARYGWFTVPRRYVQLPADCAAPVSATIRRAMEADVPALDRLHRQYAPEYSGSVVRSEDYWRRWIVPQWKERYVLEKDGALCAYFAVETKGEDLLYRDYIGRKEDMAPCFAALARQLGMGRMDKVPAALSPGNNVFTESTSPMFRLNRPFELKGRRIGTAGELAQQVADFVFSPEDGF